MSVQNFVTPQGRIAFPELFVPVAKFADPSNGPPKLQFSCTLVFPKISTDMSAFRAAFESLVQTEFKGEKRGIRNPIKDGDTDDASRPEFRDSWFVRFQSDQNHPPQVCGPDPSQKITSEHKAIYSGCWVRVVARPYAYNVPGNKGVAFGLGNVQKCRDDKPFVSISDPTEDFDMVEVGVLDAPEEMFT